MVNLFTSCLKLLRSSAVSNTAITQLVDAQMILLKKLSPAGEILRSRDAGGECPELKGLHVPSRRWIGERCGRPSWKTLVREGNAGEDRETNSCVNFAAELKTPAIISILTTLREADVNSSKRIKASPFHNFNFSGDAQWIH